MSAALINLPRRTDNSCETGLAKFEAAKFALAEALSVDEVKDIRDKAEAMRAYAVMAKDVQLELDAAELRIRAERKLGLLLRNAKETGQISKGGRPRKIGHGDRPVLITLEQAGITKDLSSRSQKVAAVSDDDFENVVIPGVRERITARNGMVSLNLSTSCRSSGNETRFTKHFQRLKRAWKVACPLARREFLREVSREKDMREFLRKVTEETDMKI